VRSSSPAIAGIIATQLSASIAYAIDLATFLASLAAVFMLDTCRRRRTRNGRVWQAIKTSVAVCILATRTARDLFHRHRRDVLRDAPSALSGTRGDLRRQVRRVLPASIAAGALVASLTSGWTKKIQRHGLMVTLAAILWGVAIVFFGLVDSIALALFFLAAAGSSIYDLGIFRGSIWNQTIPNYLRGRLARA
jgi:hypothetical protein